MHYCTIGPDVFRCVVVLVFTAYHTVHCIVFFIFTGQCSVLLQLLCPARANIVITNLFLSRKIILFTNAE